MASGYVYVLEMGDGPRYLYKIGISDNPKRRVEEIRKQCGSFNVVLNFAWREPDARKMERELHARFAEKRLQGEWFLLDCPDLWVMDKMFSAATDRMV